MSPDCPVADTCGMTYFRELYVKHEDGTGSVVAVERDDVRGRKVIDQLGFDTIDRFPNAEVSSRRTDRRANTRSKGTYR
jgi:hypothetical protein